MNITSAKFIKGLVDDDEVLSDGIPQIAFIGRSNVGKSSVINTLTKQKSLAKTSSMPGRTQQINLFLISTSGGKGAFYLVDLPGYGFAKASKNVQEHIQSLIYWYLIGSQYNQKKVVVIIDAEIGPTNNDLQMLHSLKEQNKPVVVVANKVDKIKKSALAKQLKEISQTLNGYKIIPYSAKENIGITDLTNELLS